MSRILYDINRKNLYIFYFYIYFKIFIYFKRNNIEQCNKYFNMEML